MEMLSQRVDTAKITIVQYVLLAWFFLALGASVSGWFVNAPSQPPLALGLAAVVPILLFLFVSLTSHAFRHFVRSIDPVTITALQFYRVLGVAMLVLMSRNLLPAVFALPAGWGDVAIGVTAPLVALGPGFWYELWKGGFSHLECTRDARPDRGCQSWDTGFGNKFRPSG